jgi:hypothetical protein
MMNERSGFTFSLGNLLWMMVPLAFVFAAVGSLDVFAMFLAMTLGLPAALGAICGGWNGMWRAALGFLIAYVVVFLLFAVITLLSILASRAIHFMFPVK